MKKEKKMNKNVLDSQNSKTKLHARICIDNIFELFNERNKRVPYLIIYETPHKDKNKKENKSGGKNNDLIIYETPHKDKNKKENKSGGKNNDLIIYETPHKDKNKKENKSGGKNNEDKFIIIIEINIENIEKENIEKGFSIDKLKVEQIVVVDKSLNKIEKYECEVIQSKNKLIVKCKTKFNKQVKNEEIQTFLNYEGKSIFLVLKNKRRYDENKYSILKSNLIDKLYQRKELFSEFCSKLKGIKKNIIERIDSNLKKDEINNFDKEKLYKEIHTVFKQGELKEENIINFKALLKTLEENDETKKINKSKQNEIKKSKQNEINKSKQNETNKNKNVLICFDVLHDLIKEIYREEVKNEKNEKNEKEEEKKEGEEKEKEKEEINYASIIKFFNENFPEFLRHYKTKNDLSRKSERKDGVITNQIISFNVKENGTESRKRKHETCSIDDGNSLKKLKSNTFDQKENHDDDTAIIDSNTFDQKENHDDDTAIIDSNTFDQEENHDDNVTIDSNTFDQEENHDDTAIIDSNTYDQKENHDDDTAIIDDFYTLLINFEDIIFNGDSMYSN